VEGEFCEVRGSKVEFEVALRGIGVGLYWAPDVYRALPRPDALSGPQLNFVDGFSCVRDKVPGKVLILFRLA
jgi:hypothetical protein